MNYKETIYLHGPELIQYYGYFDLTSHPYEGKFSHRYIIAFKSLNKSFTFHYRTGSIENPELKCFIPLVIKMTFFALICLIT